MSVSFEFRRAGTLGSVRALDRNRVPDFDERLHLVAEQILRHKRLGGIDKRFVDLATELTRADDPSAH